MSCLWNRGVTTTDTVDGDLTSSVFLSCTFQPAEKEKVMLACFHQHWILSANKQSLIGVL
jgi:hypothetical protein